MLIAAFAHHFAFHYRDFTKKDADSNLPFLKAFAEVSNPHDVIEDIQSNLPLPKPSDVVKNLPTVPVPKLFTNRGSYGSNGASKNEDEKQNL